MTRLFRIAIAASLLMMPLAGLADDIEDGHRAYESGDFDRAYQLFLPLAEQGNPEAQVAVGVLVDRGHGVPRDRAAATDWFVRAAEQGIPAVQNDLAARYFRGEGSDRNYAEAARWWRMAADRGMPESAYNLGLMYMRGLGFDRDTAEAMKWFRQAAEKGHARAQYSVGVSLAASDSASQDFAEAADWFRRAADQGVAEAQYNLGLLLEHGRGVPVDTDAALGWYRLAAEQGIAAARGRMAVLEATSQPTAEPAAMADWLERQDPQVYTLQLVSLSSEQAVRTFLQSLEHLGPDTGYLRYEAKGKIYYAGLYGLYPTQADAERALASLPEKLREYRPWARRIGHLQTLATDR